MIVDALTNVGETGKLTCTITLNTQIGPDTSSLDVNWATITDPDDYTNITNDTTHQILPLQRQSNTVFKSTLMITNVTETSGGREYICSADVENSNQQKLANHTVCVKGKTTIHSHNDFDTSGNN